MTITFYINDDRYEDLKYFIRTELDSARFIQNPYKVSNKVWCISLQLTVDDGNKLSAKRELWYQEDMSWYDSDWIIDGHPQVKLPYQISTVIGMIIGFIIGFIIMM